MRWRSNPAKLASAPCQADELYAMPLGRREMWRQRRTPNSPGARSAAGTTIISERDGALMKFNATPIIGAVIIEPTPLVDERGFFARSWCHDEFKAHGLKTRIAQCSISYNAKSGTLRGLHYQVAPSKEVKLVRCTRGAIHDVIVDLRPRSPSFKRWFAVELTASNRRMLYVPEGVAHGFVTLADDTEIFYQMSQRYDPACYRGVRWDDPAFGIVWPVPIVQMSERDRQFADFVLPRAAAAPIGAPLGARRPETIFATPRSHR